MVQTEYVNPSIGLVGKAYFDEVNRRIKFFDTGIHRERASVDSRLEHCVDKMRVNNATRVNARFLFSGRFEGENIEARIPLNNGFSGVELVFIGVNSPERKDSQQVLMQEEKIIRDITSQQRHEIERFPEGYSFEKLTSPSEGDILAMTNLYHEAFPTYTSVLDSESIKRMIEHSPTYVARQTEGQIVSVAVAEISGVETPNKPFRICELSEMATKREYRGRGLVTFITQKLIGEIRNSVDMIYAEARACHKPINKAFHNLGFNYAGRLMKQCVLSGDHEVSELGPYENLNVWYVLPEHKNGSN